MTIQEIINELKSLNFQIKEDEIEIGDKIAKVYDIYWQGKQLLSIFDTWEMCLNEVEVDENTLPVVLSLISFLRKLKFTFDQSKECRTIKVIFK